jgi:hypothetical protein
MASQTPRLARGSRLGAARLLVLCHVARRDGRAGSAGARRRRCVVAPRRDSPDRRGLPQARSCPRCPALPRSLRRDRVRGAGRDGGAGFRPRALRVDGARARAPRRDPAPRRRTLAPGDACVSPRATRAGLRRRCDVRPERRAPRLVHVVARATRPARAARDPRRPRHRARLVSHGEPVHTREELVAALDRDPWRG